jgi:hypothetical protein
MKVDQNKDSKIDLDMKKGNFNTYSTRTLVKPSLVAYIKSGRGAPRETSYIEHHRSSHSIQYRLDIHNSTYGGPI